MAQVAHLVQMFHLNVDNALQTGLGDVRDTAVLQVLAEEHAEAGGRERAGFIVVGEVD